MRVTLLYTITLIFCFSCLLAHSETDSLRWRYLTVEDGLPDYNVSAICQDKLGFIWVGTMSGLSRYDGYDFESFTHLLDDTSSLSNDIIKALQEDSFGQLWVGTQSGLNLLDKDRSKFVRFQHQEQDPNSLSGNEITALFEDSDKNLWVGSRDGTLHLFNREKASFTRFNQPGYTSLRGIIEDQKGELVLGFEHGGLIYFDKDRGQFLPDRIPAQNKDLRLISLLEDDDGDIWAGTWAGLFCFKPGSGELKAYPVVPDQSGKLNNRIILDLYEPKDRKGTLWIATDGGGINILDKASGTFSYITSGDIGSRLNSMAIREIYEDQNGGIWIGTINGGLNQLKSHQNQIDHFTYDNGNPTGLSGKSVLSLCESSDSNIWIGLDYGGLNYLDRNTGRFVHYLPDSQNPNSISSNVITHVYEDDEGNVYIGTYLNGFDVLNKKTGKFDQFIGKYTPELNVPDYITFFFEDSFGEFWIGTNSYGLLRFDREKKEIIRYINDPTVESTISYNIIHCIYEDASRNLWLGTADGLNRFVRENGTFQSWQHVPADTNSLIGNLVSSIYQDKDGVLWIGTDGGLNQYKEKDNSFLRYSEKNGFPWKEVVSILPGEADDLWLATNRGIVRFNKQNSQVQALSIGENIKAQQFNRGALKSRDGKLWFGSKNGLYSFYPENIRKNPIIPPVVITTILTSNEKKVKAGEKYIPMHQHISETEALKLTHRQSYVFTFEFVALNYTMSQQNQYAYQLEGFEKNWNYVGAQRHATYTNIDPGNYTFKVKASNNDGVWNEEGASVKITVLAPWWKTGWAYGSYIFIFIAAVLGIVYSEHNRMSLWHSWQLAQVEKEKAEEVNQIKFRFFTNISHEFKTPLTLIMGPLEKIISTGGGNPYMKQQFFLMRQNANRLLGLIDQLMDFRKADIGQLSLRAVERDIIPFVRNVFDSFTEQAKDENIDFDFDTSPEQLLIWFDGRKMDKVLYNLLTNAFKYTNSGESITVSVGFSSSDKKYAKISIIDTGYGIAPEEQEKIFDRFYQVSPNNPGSGIGLSLSKSLVELHHGEIKLESEAGKGSIFTILLPMGSQHLSESERAAPENAYQQKYEQKETPVLQKKWTEDIFPKAAKSNTLLIVEDELEIRFFLRETLERFYHIIEASNGEEGLEKVKIDHPDLIISDIMMPGMNGFEFCKKIKTNLNTSHIPVILLTAKTGEENQLEGLDMGADGYLTKPFSPRILLARIKNLIASRQKLKDRFLSEFNTKANEITISSVDEQFMIKAVQIVEDNISNQEFTVETLVKKMAMSRFVFVNKIKALSGQSPSQFIRAIKLKKAANLLLYSGKSISEVASDLGYITPKTFRTQFKKQFGQTPSEFIDLHKG